MRPVLLTTAILLLALLSPLQHTEAQTAEPKPAAAAPAGSGTLDEAELSRRAQSMSRTIMSPFCPGKTIDSCPSPLAHEWRDDIRHWLAQGKSPNEIVALLQARTPDFDLSGRPGAGWDWLLPIGAMALATVGLYFFVRRLRPTAAERADEDDARAAEPSGRSDGEKDALNAALDAELERLDR